MAETIKMDYRLLDFRLNGVTCEIDNQGDVWINDPDKMILMKMDVEKRLRTWKDGNYKYEWSDPYIVLLGRIAELEKDLDYAYAEVNDGWDRE